MELVSIYALARERTASRAVALLDALVPRRTAATDDHAWHDLDEGGATPSADESRERAILERLEREPTRACALHWTSREPAAPYGAMLFFTEDGAMIVSIDVGLADPLEPWLLALSRLADGAWAYVGGECAPSGSTADFETTCRRADSPKIVAGSLA